MDTWEWEGGYVNTDWSEADRADTPELKFKVLYRLYKLWQCHPDMRLTQLIENARGGDHGTLSADPGVFYNTEDFEFLNKLEHFYASL